MNAPWDDYLALGLHSEHIPELIRMAVDQELSKAKSDRPEVWAAVHAWRALAQLRATEAIAPLIGELHKIDDEHDDWITQEFPDVFAMIGPSAITALSAYLADSGNPLFARICAANSLEKIGKAHPGHWDECIDILTAQLRRFAQNDPTLNGFLIVNLVELKALQSLECMREAFNQDCVDISVMGDMEDVEIDLGVRTGRSTPKPRLYSWQNDILGAPYSPPLMRDSPKVGRNDPCPCGSGKKFKKCCLQKQDH